MENDLEFKINQETFSIISLIERKVDDSELVRLINTIASSDPDYIIHSPFPEDITSPRDNWKTYESDNLGISFEIIENTLCYISFHSNWNDLSKMRSFKNEKLIVGEIQNEQGQTTTISFGSKSLIIDKGLYPNRLSFINMSFFESPYII